MSHAVANFLHMLCRTRFSESPPPLMSLAHLFFFQLSRMPLVSLQVIAAVVQAWTAVADDGLSGALGSLLWCTIGWCFAHWLRTFDQTKKKELRADDAGLDRAGSSSGAEPTASSATVQRITKGMLAGLSPPPATVYLSPRRHGRAPGSDSSGSDGWDPKPDKRLIGRKR